MALTFKEVRRLFRVPTRGRVRTRVLVAAIINRLIDGLGVKFPKVSDKDRRRLAVGKRELSVRK